ncbi:MAG: hypothetical protein ACJ76P_13095 [Actinomycetota bacterium]
MTASGAFAGSVDVPGGRPAGFLTSRRPYVVPLVNGVRVEPLLTTGDVVGGYEMTGIPDGLGAYRSSKARIQLFMNHELEQVDGDPSNSRISHLTLNNDGSVLRGSYPVDGTESFTCFCSSTLRILGGQPWYFTGEECKQGHGGMSIALNAETGRWMETPQFGMLLHENVVPVKGLSKATFFLSEDGSAGHSQLYAYTAPTFKGAIRGQGVLRVFVPTGHTDANPSPDHISKGQTLDGKLVRISQGRNTSIDSLEAASQRKGAFDFVRIEDAEADPMHPGTVYFSDTGAADRETFRGRIYRVQLDPEHPTRASLQVVLDGSHGDDMFNPDNLAVSKHALVIQEDRNYPKSGFDRVLVYDLGDGTLRTVARTQPTESVIRREGRGDWESSGVIDASSFFGKGWWLMDVQAHDTNVPQPGPSLRPNTAVGEGGQLLKVFIPGT